MTGHPVPPALARLVAHTERWLIRYHRPGLWSAERAEGSRIRYLCGASEAELADLIDKAEAEEPAP